MFQATANRLLAIPTWRDWSYGSRLWAAARPAWMRLLSSPNAISKTLWRSYSMPGASAPPGTGTWPWGQIENETTNIGRDPVAAAACGLAPDREWCNFASLDWVETFWGDEPQRQAESIPATVQAALLNEVWGMNPQRLGQALWMQAAQHVRSTKSGGNPQRQTGPPRSPVAIHHAQRSLGHEPQRQLVSGSRPVVSVSSAQRSLGCKPQRQAQRIGAAAARRSPLNEVWGMNPRDSTPPLTGVFAQICRD